MSAARALALALCGLLLLSLPATAQEPVNTMCPLMTDEPVEADIVTEVEGHTVAFCCQRCRRDYLADPAPYADWIAGQIAVAAPAAEPAPPPGSVQQLARRAISG